MLHEKKIALSFDLENVLSGSKDDWFLSVMEQISKLLSRYNAKATFFAVGDIVDKYPELIKQLSDNGHEIGIHAANHHTELDKISPNQFRLEILAIREKIKDISGKYPLGYRAARFSLTDKTKWILPILVELGFLYDSSIVPVYLGEYGTKNAPLYPYRISYSSILNEDQQSSLWEVPIATADFDVVRVPIGGGVFFRFLPGWLFRFLVRTVSRFMVPVLYFHPHDFFESGGAKALAHLDPPGVARRFIYRRLRNVCLKSSFRKLDRLLAIYKGQTIETILSENIS